MHNRKTNKEGAVKQRKGSSVSDSGHASPSSHPSKFQDTDWPNKIAKAKEARRAGQVARKGKSATFSSHMFAAP
jgi:hypothetical protein